MINGKSFQLRFYVLLTSCNPLSIYIYEEGIAFFKIKKSDEEPTDATMDIMNLTAIQSNTMHNTSQQFDVVVNTAYRFNKKIENHIHDNKSESRQEDRNLKNIQFTSDIIKRIKQYGSTDAEGLEYRINDSIIKCMLSLQPDFIHYYKIAQPCDTNFQMSFQIFSFDIQLNDKLIPFILDMNTVNSLGEIKSQWEVNLLQKVVYESFKVLKISKETKIERIKEMNKTQNLKKMKYNYYGFQEQRKNDGSQVQSNYPSSMDLNGKKSPNLIRAESEQSLFSQQGSKFEKIFPVQNKPKNKQTSNLSNNLLETNRLGNTVLKLSNIQTSSPRVSQLKHMNSSDTLQRNIPNTNQNDLISKNSGFLHNNFQSSQYKNNQSNSSIIRKEDSRKNVGQRKSDFKNSDIMRFQDQKEVKKSSSHEKQNNNFKQKKNYYKKFQDYIHNIVKQKRSLLLSPSYASSQSHFEKQQMRFSSIKNKTKTQLNINPNSSGYGKLDKEANKTIDTLNKLQLSQIQINSQNNIIKTKPNLMKKSVSIESRESQLKQYAQKEKNFDRFKDIQQNEVQGYIKTQIKIPNLQSVRQHEIEQHNIKIKSLMSQLVQKFSCPKKELKTLSQTQFNITSENSKPKYFQKKRQTQKIQSPKFELTKPNEFEKLSHINIFQNEIYRKQLNNTIQNQILEKSFMKNDQSKIPLNKDTKIQNKKIIKMYFKKKVDHINQNEEQESSFQNSQPQKIKINENIMYNGTIKRDKSISPFSQNDESLIVSPIASNQFFKNSSSKNLIFDIHNNNDSPRNSNMNEKYNQHQKFNNSNFKIVFKNGISNIVDTSISQTAGVDKTRLFENIINENATPDAESLFNVSQSNNRQNQKQNIFVNVENDVLVNRYDVSLEHTGNKFPFIKKKIVKQEDIKQINHTIVQKENMKNRYQTNQDSISITQNHEDSDILNDIDKKGKEPYLINNALPILFSSKIQMNFRKNQNNIKDQELENGFFAGSHDKLNIENSEIQDQFYIKENQSGFDFEKKFGYKKQQNQIQVPDLNLTNYQKKYIMDGGTSIQQQLDSLLNQKKKKSFRFPINIYEKSGASGSLLSNSPSLQKVQNHARSISTVSQKINVLKLPQLKQINYVPSAMKEYYQNSIIPTNQELREMNKYINGQLSPNMLSAHGKKLMGVDKIMPSISELKERLYQHSLKDYQLGNDLFINEIIQKAQQLAKNQSK